MVDLHLHLDGSLSPEDIWVLAEKSGVALPCSCAADLQPMLQAAPDCKSLGEYLEKFQLPLQVLQTEQTIALAVYRLLKRLAADGLIYAEIRFAPQLHLIRGLTQMQVVAAAVEGLNKGISEFGIAAQLILCCMRMADNRAENQETVRVAKAFLENGVCAIDLAGNEAAFPTAGFGDIFTFAKELGVPFIIHAGEAAGADSVWQALELGAQRIGHGVRSVEDTHLVAALTEKKIPLELCFTSNLQTKAVASVGDYPIRFLWEQGVCATVNTDNMTVSGTDLRTEYKRLQKAFGLSEDILKKIACNAAEAAFISSGKKEEFKKQIAQRFEGWLTGSQ